MQSVLALNQLIHFLFIANLCHETEHFVHCSSRGESFSGTVDVSTSAESFDDDARGGGGEGSVGRHTASCDAGHVDDHDDTLAGAAATSDSTLAGAAAGTSDSTSVWKATTVIRLKERVGFAHAAYAGLLAVRTECVAVVCGLLPPVQK